MTELQPIGRYEWERLVRRVEMPAPAKLLAFTLATYADADGTRVRPGMDVLAAVTGYTDRTVRRLMGTLRDSYGLLEMVTRGGGRGRSARASVYRLTIPTDLMDRVSLLSPTDRKPETPDIAVSGQSVDEPLGNQETADTAMSGQSDPEPVDNSHSPDTAMSGESDGPNWIDRTPGTDESRLTGHFELIDRTQLCPPTTHRPTTTDHPMTHLPPQPQTAHELQSINDETSHGDNRMIRCGHGLVIRRRPDGQPSCTLCRRQSRQLRSVS